MEEEGRQVYGADEERGHTLGTQYEYGKTGETERSYEGQVMEMGTYGDTGRDKFIV